MSSVESLSCPNLTVRNIVLTARFGNAGIGMPKGSAFSIGISAFKGQKVADTNDFFTHIRRGMCIYIRKSKIGFYMRRKLPV